MNAICQDCWRSKVSRRRWPQDEAVSGSCYVCGAWRLVVPVRYAEQ